MQQTSEHNQKKIDLKLKLIKDFGFLLKFRPIPLAEHCTKYILEQGQSDLILRQDDQIFGMVYSYTKYDYEGRTILHVNCAKTHKSQKSKYDFDMKQLLLSMKVKEKAWFNVCDTPVYSRRETLTNGCQEDQDKNIQHSNSDNDLPIIESQPGQHQPKQGKLNKEAEKVQGDARDDEEKGSFSQPLQYIDGSPQLRTGYHYQIFMERLQYKNSENFESKVKVFEQKREEAKSLFSQKRYEQAAKIYNYLDSITTNLRKYKKDPQTGNYINETFYTLEQSAQLEGKNTHAKINFLKTFFKMIERTSAQQKQQAKKTIQSLLQKHQNNQVVQFLHAKWLLHLRYLDSALEAARRSYQLQKNAATQQLIALIQHQVANKHKIKVKVPVQQIP